MSTGSRTRGRGYEEEGIATARARRPRRALLRRGACLVAAIGRTGPLIAALAVLAVAFALTRRGEPPVADEPRRPALRVWDVPGCWAIELDPWSPPPPTGSTGPPGSFMLFADSVDEWGRLQETYRAVPLGDTAARRSPYRWFVRADTLWLVWSRDGVRGGLALRAADGGFVGRARLTGADTGMDPTARAEGRRINCATGRAEPDRAERR